MKKLIQILPLLLCVLMFGACSDSGPASDSAVLQDVVMIENVTSTSTTFAVALPEGRDVAYLHSGKVVKGEGVEPGVCCLIRYTSPNPPYTSADIDLLGCYSIPNIVAGEQDGEPYSDTPVYLVSAWSFCNRIIMRMQLPYPANGRKLMLQLDPATADTDEPTLRLIQHCPESTDKSYMQSYTVAFNLDSINVKKDWKGVKISLNNSNLKENVVNLNL